MIDRRNLLQAVLLLVAVAVILGLGQCVARASALPAPLERLCARLEGPGVPQWKRDLLPVIRERRIGRFEARVTLYCPNDPVDPLGGGPFAAWGGLRLRDHHCAVGTRVRAVPLGTVLYCPTVKDHLLVAVDTGPGVNGRDRLDVCFTDPQEYLAHDVLNWQSFPCWVLGKVGKEQAR